VDEKVVQNRNDTLLENITKHMSYVFKFPCPSSENKECNIFPLIRIKEFSILEPVGLVVLNGKF
jgi:hypothetical protein